MHERLFGVLAATLRRHRGNGPFQQFQKALLNAFATHVARDGGVRGLACNLIDFVDEDDAAFSLRHVVVGGLQQAHDNAVDVFAHVAGFRQNGRIGNSERHVQKACQRLGKERLAATRGAHQEQVGLFNLDIVLGTVGLPVTQTLVVVINSDREGCLRGILADDEFVEVGLDFRGERKRLLGSELGFRLFLHRAGLVFFDDAVTHGHTVTTDLHARARNHLLNTFCGLATETTNHRRVIFPATIH